MYKKINYCKWFPGSTGDRGSEGPLGTKGINLRVVLGRTWIYNLKKLPFYTGAIGDTGRPGMPGTKFYDNLYFSNYI